ncbi:hypothetical protein [Ralstonia phage RSP15]|uniref:hypothetical protein n=1 Tax=Ralstonia phage RSP15 TaxID=1785960 RepID=UPI00074D37D0|nr:hypothetical protein BH754_gp185 [Ralstonia phage RSP15]BAU40121.1 hypothetical protein [Ralstonia phage RSP15]
MRTRDMKSLFKKVKFNQSAFIRTLLNGGHVVDGRAVEVAGISNLRARITEQRKGFGLNIKNVGQGAYALA